MKHRNWFWGIFFLLAAVFVIALQVGSFGQIGVLSIAATVLLAALGIHSAFERNFFGVFIPLALLYMIYQQPLQLVKISVWLLLLAAVLAGTGCSFLFHSRLHPHYHSDWKNWDDSHSGSGNLTHTSENMDDNNPCVKINCGASSKYLHADSLTGGQFFVSFGALEVFFDQAQLSPEGAGLFLDCSFGAIKLYIPKEWQVVDHLRTSLGSVENDVRMARPGENAPRLTLTGNVQLGSVEIHYI